MAAKKGPPGKCPPRQATPPPKPEIPQPSIKAEVTERKDSDKHLRGPLNNIYVFG